jgi:hypothetical protein
MSPGAGAARDPGAAERVIVSPKGAAFQGKRAAWCED